jgi:hypothetical protein
MFDLKKAYGFSDKAANEGVKMVVGPDPTKDFVLIRRMPNEDYREELVKTFQAHGKSLELLKTHDPKSHQKRDAELQCEVLAKTIVVGWGPNFSEDGKVLKNTFEERKRVLVAYPDFRTDCVEFASNKANYPIEMDVEEVKKT